MLKVSDVPARKPVTGPEKAPPEVFANADFGQIAKNRDWRTISPIS
jgi:hypothetical protein